jgi:hypothetical protein
MLQGGGSHLRLWCMVAVDLTSRNSRVHGRKQWTPAATAKFVARTVEDLLCLGGWGEHEVNRPMERWRPPGQRLTLMEHLIAAGAEELGQQFFVNRNHHGQVVGAQARESARCKKL